VEYTRLAHGLPYAFDAVAPSPDGDVLYLLGTSPGEASGVFQWAWPPAAGSLGSSSSSGGGAIRLCSAMKVGVV
jgi:hypothetical protein